MMNRSVLELTLLTLLTWSGALLVSETAAARSLAPPTSKTRSSTPSRSQKAIASPPKTSPSRTVAQTQPVTITDITIESTAAGLQILFDTAEGDLTLPDTTTTADNALILEIPNAVLAEGEFEERQPAEGIALIRASDLPGNRVQVIVTGIDAAPTAEANIAETGLILSVVPGTAPEVEIPEDEVVEIVVTAEDENDYVVPEASTGTRIETPLQNIPQSIQVVPQEVLEDQQVIRLNEALRNVSGVVASDNDPRGQRFVIRGFEGATILRDGQRVVNDGSGFGGFFELANVEQIEVLKGPASILAGSVEPGGAINLISERPLGEPFYEVSLWAGNRDLIQPSLDLSGPLTEDGRVRYRLNALYRHEHYYRDFDVEIERYFIAPVVSWAMSDNTDLLLELEYRDDRRPYETGLVAVGDEVADIPFDRALTYPNLEATAESTRVGYQFEHRFSDNWRIRNSTYYNRYDTFTFTNNADFFGTLFDEDTGILSLNPGTFEQPSSIIEIQTNAVGEFSTGAIEHTLLAGIDFYHREDLGSELGLNSDINDTLNIFDPDYSSLTSFDPDDIATAFSTEGYTANWGFYLQDQVQLLDNLILLAGLRYDTIFQEAETTLFGDTSTSFNESSAFTPRVGVVYQPDEDISLYASYSRSFIPNTAQTFEGEIIDPEEGEQFEVGVRAELLGDRLVANLALFEITKDNVAIGDPDNPGFSLDSGGQRSQGIELDVIGEILPGWNVVANYAYTDAEVTQSNDADNTRIGEEGNRLFNVPEHNFNLWTNYRIQSGALAGLGFGLGLNFVGDRFGDLANSFELDSYFLTNAALSYERDNWRAALNFRNLFDVDYIQSSRSNRVTIYPGQGFTVVGSISIEF